MVPELEQRVLASALRTTRVVDAQGRRAVISRGQIQKDDGSSLDIADDPRLGTWLNRRSVHDYSLTVPGGWRRVNERNDITIDANCGALAVWPKDHPHVQFLSPYEYLHWEPSSRTSGRWTLVGPPPETSIAARPEATVTWLKDEDLRPRVAEGAPAHEHSVLAVLDAERILVQSDDACSIALWNPHSGEVTSLRWLGPSPSSTGAQAHASRAGPETFVLEWSSIPRAFAWIDATAGTVQCIPGDSSERIGSFYGHLAAVLDGPRFVFVEPRQIVVRDLGRAPQAAGVR